MLQNFLVFLGIVLALVGVITLGFVIAPRPFRPHPVPSAPGEPRRMRADLPTSLRRHFSETVGETPQAITSAVLWGRGRANVRGIWLPMRFKVWYLPGQGFYRRMEVTWFQRPVLRGFERLVDGRGLQHMSSGEERGEHIDQSLTLALWAAAVWMPSTLVHDESLHWEAVDDDTARLVFPFHNATESLLFHFDPETHRMTHISGSRYSPEGHEKEPWRMDLMTWKTFHGLLIPCQVAVAWGESGAPSSYWTVEGIAYNVNVADQLA